MYFRFIKWASMGSPGLAVAFMFLSVAIPVILIKGLIMGYLTGWR